VSGILFLPSQDCHWRLQEGRHNASQAARERRKIAIPALSILQGLTLPGLKAINDSEVRKCLVLVRYRKSSGDPWRRIGRRPQIETYLNDVSEKYRQPRVSYVTPLRVAIRIFDEQAVDLTSLIDQLGDYSRAVALCDDCLRSEVLGRDEVDFSSYLEPWY
jgi:hypothetical protein